MIEQDTIKLLRECDAGIKMGVQSIEDSLKYTSNGELKRTLEKNLAGHIEIQERLQGLLNSGYFNFHVDVNKHFTISKILILQTIPLEITYK